MSYLLLHQALLTYNVDEAIETLPLPSHRRPRVERYLMLHAPAAYKSPGVPLESIWEHLPIDVQEALNEAIIEALK